MNLRQLESLVWVAKLQSFAAAAEKLHTTQPTISIRIQELEKELGIVLFDRSQRTVCLTPRGRECLAYAEQILAWTEQLRASVNEKTSPRGRASLGVSEIIAHTWLSTLLSSLNEKYPGLDIDTEIDLTPRLIDGLQSGQFDVVLVGAHHLSTTFPSLFLGTTKFVWVGKPGAWSGMSPLTPTDIQAERIIVYAKASSIHQSINDWFIQSGAFPTNKITCNAAITMITLAAAGLGLTLVPEHLVAREIADKVLEIIPTEPPFDPLHYHAVCAPGKRGEIGKIIALEALQASSFDKSNKPRNDLEDS
jgi:DNA-binding transcriptional LysR family regulator